MRETFLPFSCPSLGDEEIAEVVSCLRSGWLTTGPKTAQFEKQFAHFIGSRHAIAVNSCTAALHLSLEAAGVTEGVEVITSPITFGSTAGVIEHLKAKPVFADCDPMTLTLDPTEVEKNLSAKTKVLLPVHFAGQACDMAPILDIAKTHHLTVIEDAAHALPSSYKGHPIGTLGDMTCFSFYVTKTITTGEGGIVTTNNSHYADRVRLMSLHGMSKDAWNRYTHNGSWFYEILSPGYKYNLTDIAASIGIHQLQKCKDFYERRRRIAQMYTEAFSSLPAVRTPYLRGDGDHSWHLYVIMLNLDALTISRDHFITELRQKNIGVSVHFVPLHLHPYYRHTYGYKPHDFPHAFHAYERMISLPIYPKMTDDDVADVIEAIFHIVRMYKR